MTANWGLDLRAHYLISRFVWPVRSLVSFGRFPPEAGKSSRSLSSLSDRPPLSHPPTAYHLPLLSPPDKRARRSSNFMRLQSPGV